MRFATMTRWTLTLALIATAGCQTSTENRGRLGNLPTYGDKEVATSEAPAPKLTATTFFAAGNLDEQRGNYAQAVMNYERALEASPTFLSARVRMGITLNKLGQHADATRQFEIAIQQKPTEAYLYNNLGFSLMLEERYADAVKALERAVNLKPEFARAHMNLGIAYGKLENFSKARDEFALSCSEVDACFNVAILQKEARRYADAASSLERALELNPRFEPARQQLQEVAELVKQDREMNRPAPAPAVAQGAPQDWNQNKAPARSPAMAEADSGVRSDTPVYSSPSSNRSTTMNGGSSSFGEMQPMQPMSGGASQNQSWNNGSSNTNAPNNATPAPTPKPANSGVQSGYKKAAPAREPAKLDYMGDMQFIGSGHEDGGSLTSTPNPSAGSKPESSWSQPAPAPGQWEDTDDSDMSSEDRDTEETTTPTEPGVSRSIGQNDIPFGVLAPNGSDDMYETIAELWSQGLGLEEIACHLEEIGATPTSESSKKTEADSKMQPAPVKP